MKKVIILTLSVLFMTIVFSAALSFAAKIDIIQSSNRSFSLQGYDIQGVGGLHFEMLYENMMAPQVQRDFIIASAPNVMYQTNVVPDKDKNNVELGTGKIYIAALQADNKFSGTGAIVTIAFQPVKGKPASLRITKAELAAATDSAVNKLNPTINNSPVFAGLEEQTTSNGDTGEGPKDTDGTSSDSGSDNGSDNSGGKDTGSGGDSGSPRTAYLGAVSMPSDQSGKSADTAQSKDDQEQQDQQQEPSDQSPQEPELSADGDAQPVEAPHETERPQPGQPKFAAHKGLLDQVRELKEEKTPQTLTALFGAYSIPGVKQEPPLVLSDGKTVVKVHLNLPAAGKQSPNFALKGAKLVSLKNDEKDKWVIEALPAKNANDVRVTALQDEMMTEIPLTVAQPVSKKAVSPQGLWDEGAFALFLKDRGGDKAPQFDLNGDGVRNHVDDYIYTVNYLIRNPKDPKVKAEEGKQPKPPQLPAVPNAKPVRPK